MRLGLCISGAGRVAEAILEARQHGVLDIESVHAIVDRASPFLAVARKYAIPCDVVARADYPGKEEFRAALAQHLIGLPVDALFLTFDWMLPLGVIQHFGSRILNLHMGLLPLFPGRNAIAQAAASGMTSTGVTCHLIDAGMDTGPIVVQAIVPIPSSRSEEELGLVLFRHAVPLSVQAIKWLSAGRLGEVEANRVSIRDVQFDDGPFSPALDAAVIEFSAKYLEDRFPLPSAIRSSM